MEKPAKKQPGAWVMGLFALPFAAVGVGMLAAPVVVAQIFLRAVIFLEHCLSQNGRQ